MIYYYSESTKVMSCETVAELLQAVYYGATFLTPAQITQRNLPTDYNQTLMRVLAQYAEQLPLYDAKSGQIFLIWAKNFYPRIYYENYRIIDTDFYSDLVAKGDSMTDTEHQNLRFMQHYDISELQNTYGKVFYESFVLNKNITSCQRPSYASGLAHITPYYQIDELYYLASDWNLIRDRANLSRSQIRDLCRIISEYDITGSTLLRHQIYIYDARAIGLVKHYSLFGSYYMNLFLRRYRCCLPGQDYTNAIANRDLERQIGLMQYLIRNAPAFEKTHTVYRFVEKDDFLGSLSVGDIYQDMGFMSTTRNPFEYRYNYRFGYILLKISLPANTPGVGLCIEAYSNFPEEQEIILPLCSKLKLDRIFQASDPELKLMSDAFHLQVVKKYEFTWLDAASHVDLTMPGAIVNPPTRIDFQSLLTNTHFSNVSIADRLDYFRNTCIANPNNQFVTQIAGNDYVFTMNGYDSHHVYRKYFYYDTSNGVMITSSNPRYGNINVFLEIRDDIHVNYYFRYSITDTSVTVDLDQPGWIEWLAYLSYVLGCRQVVIHGNYVLHKHRNDNAREKQMRTRYTFAENIYRYLRDDYIYFEKFSEITANFDYAALNLLRTTPISDVLNIQDRDQLYKIGMESQLIYVADFYLYITDNFPELLETLIQKISLIYLDISTNPFSNISYTFDSWAYLYNQNLVTYLPSSNQFKQRKGDFKKLMGRNRITKFKNRLRTYLAKDA